MKALYDGCFLWLLEMWKENYENSGRFAFAHFLATHSCLHPAGYYFSFEPFVISSRRNNPQGTDFIKLGALY
jgi:hypothetical protein